MDGLNIVEAARAVAKAWSDYQGRATLTVGLLADRRAGRIFQAANERGYAILSFLETINRACAGNRFMAGLRKSMTTDAAVYLCHHEPAQPWKTVVFEIEFLPSPLSGHLELVVSTFVAFGAPGDPTHYPLDVSTNYRRDTQELFPVIEMSASRISRQTSQSESTDERVSGSSHVTEQGQRDSSSYSDTHGRRDQFTRTAGEERADNRYSGNPFGHTPSNHIADMRKDGHTYENSQDQRHEHQRTRGAESSVTDRSNRDELSRQRATSNDDRVTEIRYDVKFSAVGIDYSQPDRLFAAWRAHPENAEASKTIDMFLRSLSDCNETIQAGIGRMVLASRDQRGAGRMEGPELNDEFLARARQLIMIEEGFLPFRRRLMSLDGRPRPIDAESIRELIQSTHGKLPLLGPTFGGTLPTLLAK